MKSAGLPGAWVLEVFQRGGVDVALLTEQYPDEVDMVLYRPDAVPPDSLNKLLTACATISGNQNFGLSMNGLVDITMYGLYGYILLQTNTVKDFLEALVHYYPLLYPSAFFEVRTQEDSIIIQYGTRPSPKLCSRHDTEWSLGFVAGHLKFHIDGIAKPLSASFQHQSANDLREQESLFGQKLLFNQRENQLVYPKSILGMTFSDRDPLMLKVLRKHADKLLLEYSSKGSFEQEIRMLIFENIEQPEQGKNKANASNIAHEMNLSLSTFKRRLTKENINFRETKDLVRNQLAKEILLGTKVNIADIARKVGFSEQSSFTRFFIRCNALTPQEYRKKYST